MSDNSGKILIVDDEEAICTVLEILLEKFQKDLLIAPNGLVALDIIKSNNDIVCVLTDIKMPVMDGLTLVKEVRKLGNDVPFLLYTGYGDKEFMQEALKHGVYDFIIKPDFEKLELKVSNAIGSTKSDDRSLSEYKKLAQAG